MAEVTDETRLTVVKLLANGNTPGFVGQATSLSKDQVIDIAKDHGHPDRNKLTWAAGVLQRNLDAKRMGLPEPTRPASPAGASRRPVPDPRPNDSTRPAEPAPENNHGPELDAAIVSTAMIEAHPSNTGRDLGDLRDLATSIADHGVLVPLVLERRAGRYRIRDGHRRWAAAKIAKVGRVPAIIHAQQLDQAAWLLESLEYNHRRKGYTAEDLRRVVGQLVDLRVSRGAIGQAVGMSWSQITKLIQGRKEPTIRAAPRLTPMVSRKALREFLDHCEKAGYNTDVQVMLAALVDGRPWRTIDEATEPLEPEQVAG